MTNSHDADHAPRYTVRRSQPTAGRTGSARDRQPSPKLTDVLEPILDIDVVYDPSSVGLPDEKVHVTASIGHVGWDVHADCEVLTDQIAAQFLGYALDRLPHVSVVQTDHAPAFGLAFTDAATKRGLRHVHRSPESPHDAAVGQLLRTVGGRDASKEH